ncbi:MAG: hypothetical protein AB1393_11885 [Candidatus Edwardsbacteria bacterium]
MKIVEYVVIFDDGVRKRHCHKSERGKILEFVVQLEVRIDDVWYPIVRYDCAHKSTHIDYYDLSGRKSKMELHLEFNEALIVADDDIRENWDKYLKDFLKGRQ